MYKYAEDKVTANSQGTQDPKTANHHWYPFLRYQEQCQAAGKEATINDWMRSNGKLNEKIEFEKRKSAAAAAAATASQAKKANTDTSE